MHTQLPRLAERCIDFCTRERSNRRLGNDPFSQNNCDLHAIRLSIHRLMNGPHECFRNSNTLNWNAICICNMVCSHRKFKCSDHRPNMCNTLTHTHTYSDTLIQAQAHNMQWFVQSGKCAALKRISMNLLPKFEWIRLEWHCFINPVCVSIDIYDSI